MAGEPKDVEPVQDTPGFVPIEDFLARRAGLTSAGIGEKITSAYKSVAKPVTGLLGSALASDPRGRVAQAAGSWLTQGAIPPPASTEDISRYAASQFTGGSEVPPGMGPAQFGAEAIVPQSPTEAAIMAATGGAGKAAALAKLGPWASALTRMGGATAGGALGGSIDEEGSTARGAVTGLAQGGLGETIGAGVGLARNLGIERVTKKIQLADAVNTGAALERIPKLQGVFNGLRTPEQLRDLALGTVTTPDGKTANRGLALLQDAQEKIGQQIGIILENPPAPPQGIYGPEFWARKSGFFPDPQNPDRFLPWDEARKSLSELGAKAFGGAKSNPLDPTIKGVDPKQAYAEAIRSMQRYLGQYDPSGTALKLFNDGQGQYEAGRAVLKELRGAFRRLAATEIAFNSDVLQKALSDRQVALTKKLGPDGYDALAGAVFRGEGPGYRDVFTPSGVAAKISEMIPLPGPAYARMHLGKPELVGNPLALGPGSRLGIDLATQAATQPLANLGMTQIAPLNFGRR